MSRGLWFSVPLVAAITTGALACMVWPVGMWAGCETAERIVVGTVLAVEEYTPSELEERFLREARFGLERTVSGPAAPDTVILVGPQVEPSMCSWMETNPFEVGGRYLLRLAPALGAGRYLAPIGYEEMQPGRIRLGSAPSAEESILAEYAGYFAEHCARPFSLSAEIDTSVAAGGSARMHLTVQNHLSVPLVLIDAPTAADGDPLAVHLLLRVYPASERYREWLPQRELHRVVAPGDQTALDLDLVELYGLTEERRYDVAGYASIPMQGS
ncbi:MAG: hypothetical protein AB1505_27490 [Candidatus Latescibacterota bacterium]